MSWSNPFGDAELATFTDTFRKLAANVEQVVLGKPDVVRLALIAMFAEGHILIEDVPGVGKTTLARAISASVRGKWRRLQFTPDLLPSDVTGVTIFNQQTRDFEFHPGPIFANVVIGDEINRASPKTQAALLEVMEEGYVTVDGVRHPVPQPFMVAATQNPVEMDGTYRLPEAQLDRFFMRITVGYPDENAEIEVLRNNGAKISPDNLSPVTDTETVSKLIDLAKRVYVHDALYSYAVRIATATRHHPEVRLGLSPRGAIALIRAGQVFSLAVDRTYVVPEDLKALAEAVMAHRLVLTPDAQLRGRTAADIVAQVLGEVSVPQPEADSANVRGPAGPGEFGANSPGPGSTVAASNGPGGQAFPAAPHGPPVHPPMPISAPPQAAYGYGAPPGATS